jgi:hypothetical protein
VAGELWRSQFQIARETVYGADTPATRRVYWRVEDSVLTREQEPHPYRFATGGRDNVRGFTLGPQAAGGTLSLPLSAGELLEPLLMTVRGGVTPTTPAGATAARAWVFAPGGTGAAVALDSATIEWQDGANPWAEHGCYGNRLRIAGAVGGENLATVELFGAALEAEALTTGLAERVPDFLSGWETRFYVDDVEGPPGTTLHDCLLLSWDISLSNNLDRKFAAHNSQSACAITIGELETAATLTVEAADPVALAEFGNWTDTTPRLLRVVFGGNTEIEAGHPTEVRIDLPGYWSAFDLGQTGQGTRVYELRFQPVYDATLGYSVQITCVNDRTAAWT